MRDSEEDVRRPLLNRPPSSNGSVKSAFNSASESGSNPDQGVQSRSIEDAVLPERAILGRNLSWQSAYILVISRVIGSGIFAAPGAIVQSVGSVGLTIVVWVVGAIIAACGLAISLEFGCMLPRSGGDKLYLEFTYRRPRFLASTLVAVQAVLLGFTASNCIVFGEYVLFAFNIEPTTFMRKSLALALMTAVTVIHGCFLRTGIHIQNFLGWIKVVLIPFMVFAGIFAILFRRNENSSPKDSAQITWPGLWEGSNWNWAIVSTAFFKVSYTFAGLSNVNYVMNEVKDPVRTLKSVSFTALITAGILYLFINCAYFAVIPIEEIKSSGELIAALFFERSFGPRVGKTILPLAVALSAAGNVMAVTFTLARLNQEIARQGFLPFSRFISSSYPFNAPLGGLIVHYIPSVLVIALPPPGKVYSFILDVEGYPGQIFGLAISLGLIWLRYRRPELKRPYKAPLIAILLRIATNLALISAPFFPIRGKNGEKKGFHATHAIVGTSVIIFGVIYWYVWTILIPRWKGYRLEEEVDVLDDGTTITKLVKVH